MTGPGPADGPARPVRDPARSLRAVAGATLGLEALVLLLAVLTIYGLHHRVAGPDLGALLGLAAACLVAGALQRRRAGPALGAVLQLLVVLAGVVLWPLYVLGLCFGALWFGYLRLRRDLTARSVQ